MPVRISALVMTLNEERNIEFCLRSVASWCDEVIVVDMESDDRTREIAEKYAHAVVSHPRIAAFDAARQVGVDRTTGDWIFSIDADEIATPELARWLRDFVTGDPPYEVAIIPRVNVFLGQRMHGTRWWPGKPRFFRPGAMVISGKLHRGLLPRRGARVATLPRDPDVSIWQFSHLSMTLLIEKLNRYTTVEAQQARAAGRKDPGAFELVRAPLKSLFKYLARRGYRDGVAGLAYLASRMFYAFMVRAKRWDEGRLGTRQAEYDRMREAVVSRFADPPAGDSSPSSPGDTAT